MTEQTITGVIYKIDETQQVSEKFSKRELILKTSGDYPQYIPVQFTNKNIDKLNAINKGQEVTIHYNLNGRLWNSPKGEEKCFCSLDGWKVDVIGSAPVIKSLSAPVVDDLPF